MGTVYPWKAVEEHRIPTVAAFDTLREEALRRTFESEAVVAAAVYGSVARGDQNIRSDLDLLVVYRTSRESDAANLLRELRSRAEESNIILSAHSLSVREGRSRNHPFGPSYRDDWGRLRETGNVVGVPARHVYPPLISVAEEMVKAMPLRFGNIREIGLRLRRAFRNPGLDDIDAALEVAHRRNNRPLHFYVACARWLMRWKNGYLAHESRAEVTRAFLANRFFARLHEPFIRLAEIDRAYDELLGSAIRQEIDRQTYLLTVRQYLRDVVVSNELLSSRARKLIVRFETARVLESAA